MTTEATAKPISSAGLLSGPTPCAKPDGPTTSRSGQDRARASRSRRPAKGSVSRTLDTSGPIGFGSSTKLGPKASAGLTAFLVSSLQRRATGSILYELTWKAELTPSGRLIYRLRASNRVRTSVSDSTGWPTPTTPSGGQTWPPGTSPTGRRPDGSKATVNLEQVARIAGWITCRASDGEKNTRSREGLLKEIARKGAAHDLTMQAMLTGWATPAAAEAGGTPEQFLERKRQAIEKGAQMGVSLTSLALQAQIAGWPTTTTTMADSRNGANATAGRSEDQIGKHHSGQTLVDAARISGWVSPQNADGQGSGANQNTKSLCRQTKALRRMLIVGAPSEFPDQRSEEACADATGSSVTMAASGLLNPAHSRWLLRIPPEWDSCGATAIASTRKRRRRS